LTATTPVVLLAQGGGHGHELTVGVSVGPTFLRVALLVAVPAVAAFAVLRGFLAEPGRRSLAAVVATAGVAATLELLLSGGLNLSERWAPVLLALLAVPLYLVLSRDERFAPTVDRARRMAPWVFWPAAALAAQQFAQAWLTGAGPARAATMLHTGVVLALVAMAWFVVSRPRRAATTVSVRLGAGALAMVLIAGVGQAMVLRPAAPVPGVVVAAEYDTDDDPIEVLVVPNRPGNNLVRVSGTGALVGTSAAELTPAWPRPGANGAWTVVTLPEGPSEVLVSYGGRTISVAVDTGTATPAPTGFAGPDGAECASALLGRAIARTRPAPDPGSCPDEALTPADADSLRAIVATLAEQGHRWFIVAADASPRGQAADAVVRDAAARLGLEVRLAGVSAGTGPLVVVSGWTAASLTLRANPDADVRPAPWLATEPSLVPGLAALPGGASVDRYREALREQYPGVSPSVSGYQAWLAESAAGPAENLAGPAR
jgi:hypothetical protein